MNPYPTGTMAAYYWYGIRHNLFPISMAHQWAELIARSSQPSTEFAAVARANGREEILEALHNAISDDTDLADIGRSLLGYISDQLGEGKIGFREAIQAASQIAKSTGLTKEACAELGHLLDAYFGLIDESIRVLRSLS